MHREYPQAHRVRPEMFVGWTAELARLRPTGSHAYAYQRIVRNFLLFHARDHTGTFIPDLSTLPKPTPVVSPRLISEAEMARVLEVARSTFVDEAHCHKNLFYVTKMTRIAGLPQTASQRAFDMFLKVLHVQRINGGGGVVFATGTPIANSVAEMFTMQRYLQMAALKALNVGHFDAWAATFGEPVTAMELAPDGSGYRLNTRFASNAGRGITGVMPTSGLCRIEARLASICTPILVLDAA